MAPRTLRLTLQYAGTAYSGWQYQPGRPTVQGTVEEAVRKLLQGDVRITGAGRTDAGVHARAQVAHLRTESDLSVERLRAALNHILPWDIRILDAAEAPDGFHARKWAVSKEYRYRIHRGDIMPPDQWPYALLVRGPLDLESMRIGAAVLLGEHDFASFQCAGSSARTTVRTVLRSEWTEEGDQLVYSIEADGFLYKMVRTVVGSLLEIGHGKRAAAHLAQVLDSRDRSQAGPVVPARGLHLWSVTYPRQEPPL